MVPNLCFFKLPALGSHVTTVHSARIVPCVLTASVPVLMAWNWLWNVVLVPSMVLLLRTIGLMCFCLARSCLASNQCPSGAECVNGECRCSPGLALSRYGFCMPQTYGRSISYTSETQYCAPTLTQSPCLSVSLFLIVRVGARLWYAVTLHTLVPYMKT